MTLRTHNPSLTEETIMAEKKSVIYFHYPGGVRVAWKFWNSKHLKGWAIMDPDKYIRVLEPTWALSVPRIREIAANHGATVASDSNDLITCTTCPACNAYYGLTTATDGTVTFCGCCGYPDPAPCNECGLLLCRCGQDIPATNAPATILSPIAPAGAIVNPGQCESLLDYLMRGGGEIDAY